MINITSDLLAIASRLREIDGSYRVFYNNALDRFEIHNRDKPIFLSLCFVANELDNRVLDTARRTRKENFDEIEGEIDAHNLSIEMECINRLEQSNVRLGSMLEFASNANHDVVFTKPSGEWF